MVWESFYTPLDIDVIYKKTANRAPDIQERQVQKLQSWKDNGMTMTSSSLSQIATVNS